MGAAQCSKYLNSYMVSILMKLMVLTVMKGVAHTTPVTDSIIILVTDCDISTAYTLAWRGSDTNNIA